MVARGTPARGSYAPVGAEEDDGALDDVEAEGGDAVEVPAPGDQ